MLVIVGGQAERKRTYDVNNFGIGNIEDTIRGLDNSEKQ